MRTHYWRRPAIIDRATYLAIADETRRLLTMMENAGVSLAGPYGHGRPLVDDDHIRFNAPHPTGWDTFVFDRIEGDGLEVRESIWEHCTTLPSYDAVARGVLLIAQRHLGDKMFVDAPHGATTEGV
jgi:hypothetical protein